VIARLLLAIMLLVAGTGCGKRAVVEQSSSSEFDTEAREDASVSTSLSLTGDPADFMAEAARAETDGNFGKAIDVYERLIENGSTPEEIREEALFRLGMAYGDARNGNRNYEAAVRELTRFVEAYPESKYNETATASRDKFRELLEN
jgi:outer membrane protein assembly factor BamD (BamD/ComL family)